MPDDRDLGIAPGDLPHAPPARLVVRVLERGETSLVCEGRVPRDSPYVRGTSCPAFLGLELAAQAAALLERPTDAAAGVTRTGYLVRVRSTSFRRPEFSLDALLLAQVRRVTASGALIAYAVTVRDELGELLSGDLSTWVVPPAPPL